MWGSSWFKKTNKLRSACVIIYVILSLMSKPLEDCIKTSKRTAVEMRQLKDHGNSLKMQTLTFVFANPSVSRVE